MSDKTWIPEISDERLAELVERIKPVVRFGKKPFYIEPVDPKKVAYMWSPKKAAPATGLVPIRDITTNHRYGYYGLFKPSIAEVLAFVEQSDLDAGVIAFEIVAMPEDAVDLNRETEALNAGYHVAMTRLYRAA